MRDPTRATAVAFLPDACLHSPGISRFAQVRAVKSGWSVVDQPRPVRSATTTINNIKQTFLVQVTALRWFIIDESITDELAS